MVTLSAYLEEQYLDALKKLPEESPKITSELLSQYKEIVVTTIIQQFGLGSLVHLQDKGAHVTTLHNAKLGTFADGDVEEQQRFNTPYSQEVRKKLYEKGFKSNRKKEFQSNPAIYDGYTGKELPKDGRAHKDHIISAAAIHKNDEARLYMSDEVRGSMAVDEKNLTWAEGSMNQSKDEHDLMKWMNKTSAKHPELKNKDRFGIDEQRAKEKYKTATQHVESSVKDAKKKYYKKKLTGTSMVQGKQMAKRQAIGIFLYQLQAAFFSEMASYFQNFRTYKTNKEKYDAFKLACQNVQKRALSMDSLKKVFTGYTEGFIGGVISNLFTVFINTFVRTTKNIVRIITEGTNSFIQAVRLMLFPPEEMTREQAIYEGSKIIVASVITSVGVIITEAFIKYLETVPPIAPFASLIGGILGGVMTGIVSTSVIYAMDNFGSIMQRVNAQMKEVAYYTVVSPEQLKEKYYAAIAEIDTAYEEVLKKVYVEYEQLHLLTKDAYDLNQNANKRYRQSQKLARGLQVDQNEILSADEDILAFFKE